jgi:predicted PurR-regulated permease PerM
MFGWLVPSVRTALVLLVFVVVIIGAMIAHQLSTIVEQLKEAREQELSAIADYCSLRADQHRQTEREMDGL